MRTPLSIDKSKSIAENFISNMFPNADSSYQATWQNRFNKGLEYAIHYMDLESRKCFSEIVLEFCK